MTDSNTNEAATNEAADDQRSEPRSHGRAGLATTVAVLALLVALGAAAAAGWLWYQGERRLASYQERLATVERGLEKSVQEVVLPRLNELEGGVQTLRQRDEEQAGALASLGSRMDRTRVQISKLAGLVEGGQRRWRLLEIESLLLAANERLQLYRDPESARQALVLANRRLGALDDPRLFAVRERVVDEIAALEALPRADVEGLALALTDLIDRVAALPLASDVPADYAGDAGESVPDLRERPWRELLDSMREALSAMVTIRRTEDVHRPLMPPEQEFFLRQNLSLKLESARLALFQRDTASYRSALNSAREWLGTYFETADPRVTGALEKLNEIRRVELAWEAPDITGSLEALREVLRQNAGDASDREDTAGGVENDQGDEN